MHTLLIIDGNALLHRAYHALPDFKRKDGIPTNAVYGFASVLHKVRTDIQPTHLAVCFDTAAPTFRDEMYENYRAHRPDVDQELISQFPIAREFLQAAGITFFEKEGVEADDLIAVIVLEARKGTMQTIILTGDRDLFQLVDDHTRILTPGIGVTKGQLYDREGVLNKFGVPPEKIADFKALTGDPSDNYHGVKGIGPKTAARLIDEFASIENLYQHLDRVPERIRKLLLAHKVHALLSKELAILKSNIEGVHINLDQLLYPTYQPELRSFFEKYQFLSLEKRFFVNQVLVKAPKEALAKDPKNQLGLF